MQPTTNLLFRNDTILGVCEAIGQDFGFHPNWLRVTLGSLIYFAPVAVVGSYLVAGVIVAATRYFAPDELVALPAAPVADYELLEAGIEVDAGEMQLAA